MNTESRTSDPTDPKQKKEDEALDKTIADSFPASDPPSSIPDPDENDDVTDDDKEDAA